MTNDDFLESELFHLGTRIRYHERRASFYGFYDRLFNFLNIILGSSAIYAITAKPEQAIYAAIISLAITVVSTISLVFRLSIQENIHLTFLREFHKIYNDAVMLDKNTFYHYQLEKIRKERLELEADEPTKKYYIDFIAYNEQCMAMGYDEKAKLKLHWWHYCFANWTNWRSSEIKTFSDSDINS